MSGPAPLPSIGLVLGAGSVNQGGAPAFLPHIGLLLSAGGGIVVSSQPGAGRPSKRRRRYQVEVDGEVFDVDSQAEAEAVLKQAAETAREQAKTAVERAAKATRREPRKVVRDARRAMPEPTIDAPAELADMVARAQAEIRQVYASAMRDIEISLLMRKAELEADDEDVLLLL